MNISIYSIYTCIVLSIIYHYLSQLINVNVFRIVLHDSIKKKEKKKGTVLFQMD